MFNKKKYISYISSLELLNIILMFIITILLTILFLLIFKKLEFALLGFVCGILISSIININRNIKAEKMKWEIDLYEKIMEK